jgi:hypothetical protein
MIQLIKIASWLCALCASLAFTSTTLGQAATVYHPGDKITYKVTFEGSNADKLDRVILNFQTNNVTRKGQDSQPFQSWVESSGTKMVAPGAYEVSIEVPAFAASGTYQINVISTLIGAFNHQDRAGLPNVMLSIDNPKEVPGFPEVKSVEQAH